MLPFECALNRGTNIRWVGQERLPYNQGVKIKMSISLAPELGEALREASAGAGMTLSEWLAQAAETKLRKDGDARMLDEAADKRRLAGMRAFLDEWEAEHGAFTKEELAEAARAREMGVDWPPMGEGE